jgi:hypothetical protein
MHVNTTTTNNNKRVSATLKTEYCRRLLLFRLVSDDLFDMENNQKDQDDDVFRQNSPKLGQC